MSRLKGIDAAREYLLSEGELPDHLARSVRPDVLQSWRRSLLSGAQLASPTLVFKGEHQARAALRIAADPVLTHLADQLSGLSAGVLLADREATLVQRWVPDAVMHRMFDRIHAETGFDNSEESIGTNGLGSVIEQDGPLQISGPEHLADALRPFTCVGVPVHHPITRRLEGVITLSCQAMFGNPLLTPLMTATAQEVESRLLAQASVNERQLLDEYLVAIGSRRAPVAAIGQDICIAGPKVTELLERVDRAALWEYVRAVAVGSKAAGDPMGVSSSQLRIGRCKAVERDGVVIGALVEFALDRPSHEEREQHHATLPKPTVTLPGKSAALARVIAQSTRFATKGVPILIEGEPGVGKFALTKAVLTSVGVELEKVAVLDAAALWSDETTPFVTVLRRELELHPDALLLRHLDALTPEAASAAAALLEQLEDDVPRIVATMTTVDLPAPGLRRLIDTVGVGRVSIPPLRDRRDDIGPTAIALLNKHRGNRQAHFSSAALRCLMRAPWPGNLRQMEATVRGLLSTAIGPEIGPDSLPAELQGNTRKRDLSAIEELELGAILESLRRHEGNKVAAAQSIGISRSTLYRKLQAYHIDPDKQYF